VNTWSVLTYTKIYARISAGVLKGGASLSQCGKRSALPRWLSPWS